MTAWHELASRAVEPNPFFEPEFVLPAARWFGESRVELLVVHDAGDWAAVVPVRRHLTWRLMPLPALAVWRHDYCFLGTPLVDRERTAEATSALVDTALAAPRVGFVALDSLAGDGPVAQSIADRLEDRGLEPVLYRSYERAALRRRHEPTYLDETRSPHHRREGRRQRRRLERDLEATQAVEDRAGDPAAVEDFLRLEASGWKGGAGTAFLSRPGHAAFFRELCAGLAAQGHLQLLATCVGSRLVAMKTNLRAGDGLFCFKIAHDETLGRYSPGVQLEVDTVELFHADKDLAFMDSCAAPENDMINRLWPDRRPIVTSVLPTPGPLGWAASRQAPISASLEARLRLRKAT
ncbi:MAG: GNAT family N-acetyltransferase [Gaiellaceae bacterium MAG52_C11]|nr:GNAT family N-acetyltransferase [Candidatus Gaiellasilicea maunaloa]